MTIPDDSGMPFPFYLCGGALVVLGGWCFSKREEGFGIPALMVILTVAVWYWGDALYNDYGKYERLIGKGHLGAAWWQVLLFLVAFVMLVPPIHRWMNKGLLRRSSFALLCQRTGRLNAPGLQAQLSKTAMGLFVVWGGLMAVAVWRVEWNFISLFAPYLSGEKVDPWARGRLGGGLDALLSLAQYFQTFLAAAAGIILALSRDSKVRGIALAVCVLALPYFIFDRTRNTMLATILPGLLAWVFLRLKSPLYVKGVILAAAFLGISQWFAFVMENRQERSIAGAVRSESYRGKKETKHAGLNMLEELGWINRYISNGRYKVNMGERYFAEAVNPIPRALWKGKPLIGIDYAIARGQASRKGSNLVTATISTGMVGQGVVNFGRFFGPVAAAVLMALWVAILTRQDLQAHEQPTRLLLYACGLILTFNMGRDITLLVLYPFFFGLGLFWILRNINRDARG
ncbi:MAG: hypothetical protein ACSHYF_10130 [Verrucomicrobiaceae bacterium]